MYKFAPLTRYLESCESEVVLLSFSDIERIISDELCPSARKYVAYWHLSKTHMLPQAVDSAGYTMESVSLAEEKIVLRRK